MMLFTVKGPAVYEAKLRFENERPIKVSGGWFKIENIQPAKPDAPDEITLVLTPTVEPLPTPDPEVVAKVDTLHKLATEGTVTDADEYRDLGKTLRTVSGLHKEIETDRFKYTRPLDARKTDVMAVFSPLTDRLNAAKVLIQQKLNNYERAERERVREQQRLAEEAAREEAERLRREAFREEDAGNFDEAANLAAQATMAAAPVVPVAAIPKVAGISHREVWTATVIDFQRLVEAAAENPTAYLRFLAVNERELREYVNSAKAAAVGMLPGVEVTSEKKVAG